MPLTVLHALVGAAAGAAYYAADTAVSGRAPGAEKMAHAALIGSVAGAMPDILEPPVNRYHRSFFHSFATLAAATALIEQIDANEQLDAEQKTLARSAVAAYLSHLLLDSRTPMGLPLLFDPRGFLHWVMSL